MIVEKASVELKVKSECGVKKASGQLRKASSELKKASDQLRKVSMH